MSIQDEKEQARLERNKRIMADVIEVLMGCAEILQELQERSFDASDDEILACWCEVYHWCKSRGGSMNLAFDTATETIQKGFPMPPKVDRMFAALFVDSEPVESK